MPDEFAFRLDDHDIMAVEPLDDFRRPEIREGCKLLVEVDGGHGQAPGCKTLGETD